MLFEALLFLSVCNYHNRKDMDHSSQGEKQNEDSLSGSNFRNLCEKRTFWQKNRIVHLVMRTVKK
jgi:hypothetical protein